MANTKTTTAKKASGAATSAKTEKTKKFRISRGMIIEILLLAATLLNTSLVELPWRLILPFVIGVWTIWVKYREDKRLFNAALIESLFMALNIAANLLPLWWRLAAFFLLGVRSIVTRYKHKHRDGKNCYCDEPYENPVSNTRTRKK